MILDQPGGGGPMDGVDFQLGVFVPAYQPKVKDVKERNLSSEPNPCDGEHTKDTGSKNRTFNISGVALLENKWMLEEISEAGTPMMLQSMKWSGEVLVEKVERSEIRAWDGRHDTYWFDYTIDAKSTGKDEAGETNFGIIGYANSDQGESDAGRPNPGQS